MSWGLAAFAVSSAGSLLGGSGASDAARAQAEAIRKANAERINQTRFAARDRALKRREAFDRATSSQVAAAYARGATGAYVQNIVATDSKRFQRDETNDKMMTKSRIAALRMNTQGAADAADTTAKYAKYETMFNIANAGLNIYAAGGFSGGGDA